jgi:hypothetical protein
MPRSYALLSIYELASNPGPYFLAEDDDFTADRARLDGALLFELREAALAKRRTLPNRYQFAVAVVEHTEAEGGLILEYEIVNHPDDDDEDELEGGA